VSEIREVNPSPRKTASGIRYKVLPMRGNLPVSMKQDISQVSQSMGSIHREDGERRDLGVLDSSQEAGTGCLGMEIHAQR